MERNGRALCSSGTDLVLHLDYGEDWTEKVKNRETWADAKRKPGPEKSVVEAASRGSELLVGTSVIPRPAKKLFESLL